MTTNVGPSIQTVCPFCGGREADPQTGRCLTCGKKCVNPDLAAEFGHPVLQGGHMGEPRRSPSAAYRARPLDPVNHGADRQVAGSLLTVIGDSPVPSNGHAPAPAPPAEAASLDPPENEPPPTPPDGDAAEVTFKLPALKLCHAWYRRTQELREQLAEEAVVAEEEAAELRSAVETLDHLLGRVVVDGLQKER